DGMRVGRSGEPGSSPRSSGGAGLASGGTGLLSRSSGATGPATGAATSVARTGSAAVAPPASGVRKGVLDANGRLVDDAAIPVGSLKTVVMVIEVSATSILMPAGAPIGC